MKYHQILHDDMRPIPGFENYLINTKGDVYSLHSNALEVITVTETDRLVRVCPLQKE